MRGSYRQEAARVPLSLTLTAQADEPLTLTVADEDGHTVTVCGEAPCASDRAPDVARMEEQLARTGGTPFAVTQASAQVAGNVYVPASALGALRREALQRLTAARGQVVPVPFAAPATAEGAFVPAAHTALVGRFSAAEQATEAAVEGLAAIVLPLTADAAAIRQWSARCAVGVELPRALFMGEEVIARRLAEAKAAGATWALCGNIGALPLCREAGLPTVGHFSLNVTNSAALAALAEQGVTAAVLSMELQFSQMRLAAPPGMALGFISYGRLPLMLMRPCPRRAAVGCRGCDRRGGLVDRKGVVFPLVCGEGYTELLNSVPLDFADRPTDAPRLAFEMLYFTTETPEAAAQVVRRYVQGGAPQGAITRGLYRRGVE